ncbi:MAG TPA: hypothetical protein VGP27_10435 [Mycobacterium sp.]|nr:hypothetical protein [Mycobacterium sp.]
MFAAAAGLPVYGRVGPGGEYVGVRAGVELKPKRGRSRYYVGVSAGRRVSY